MRDLGTPLAPTFGGGGKKRKNKCKKTKGKGSSCGIGPSKKQRTVAGDVAAGLALPLPHALDKLVTAEIAL